MARWKLTEKHYLNVPGTRWEFQTVDRTTGRPQRKTFPVPLYLDPENPDDCNYKDGYDNWIIVAYEGSAEGRDIIFIGDPTPGMLPIDDEAKAISAKFKWTPTQGLDDESKENSYQSKLLLGLIDQMADMSVKASAAPIAPGMEQFLTQMTQMMQQQTQILAALAGKGLDGEFAKQAKVLGEQHVVDTEDPLPEAEAPTAEEIEQSAKAFAAAEAASGKVAQEKLARSSRRL